MTKQELELINYSLTFYYTHTKDIATRAKLAIIQGKIRGNIDEPQSSNLPELREYFHNKYPNEVDDDLITMIEDLIERRRERGYRSRGT